MKTDKQILDGLLRDNPESFFTAAAAVYGGRMRFLVAKSVERSDCYDIVRVEFQIDGGRWVDAAEGLPLLMSALKAKVGMKE